MRGAQPAPIAEPAKALALIGPNGQFVFGSIAKRLGGVLAYVESRMPRGLRHLCEGWTIAPVLVVDQRRARVDPFEAELKPFVRGG